MHITFKLVLAAPAALFAGLVPALAGGISVADADNWPLTSYSCAGGENLPARFSDDAEYATIDQMGERILMKRVSSASGVRYHAMDKDYTYELDTKGSDATLYEAGDKVVLEDCVAR